LAQFLAKVRTAIASSPLRIREGEGVQGVQHGEVASIATIDSLNADNRHYYRRWHAIHLLRLFQGGSVAAPKIEPLADAYRLYKAGPVRWPVAYNRRVGASGWRGHQTGYLLVVLRLVKGGADL